MSKGVEYSDPLPEDPTSPEAHQMVAEQYDGDQEKAEAVAYMSGYFDAEGCIQQAVGLKDDHKYGYQQQPHVLVQTAQQMAGFFDGEGCIQARVSTSENHSLDYSYKSRICAQQNSDRTIVEDLFESYCSLFDVEYTIQKQPAQKEGWSATVTANVHGGYIENFLRPLVPILREKRRQAIIMLEEILPRYRDGVHLTKRGFIEMMRWKKKLDKEKPMGNEDRKYTVEYFEELWGDDIKAQRRLSEYAGGHE